MEINGGSIKLKLHKNLKGGGMIPANYQPGAIEQTGINYFNAAPIDPNFTADNKYVPVPSQPEIGETPQDYFDRLKEEEGLIIQPEGKKLFEDYLVSITQNFQEQQMKMLDQAKKNRDLEKMNQIIDGINSVLSFIVGLFPGGEEINEAVDGVKDGIKSLIPEVNPDGWDYSEQHMEDLNQENIEAFKENLNLINPWHDLTAAIKTPQWYNYLQSVSQVKPDVSIFAPGGMKTGGGNQIIHGGDIEIHFV